MADLGLDKGFKKSTALRACISNVPMTPHQHKTQLANICTMIHHENFYNLLACYHPDSKWSKDLTQYQDTLWNCQKCIFYFQSTVKNAD